MGWVGVGVGSRGLRGLKGDKEKSWEQVERSLGQVEGSRKVWSR